MGLMQEIEAACADGRFHRIPAGVSGVDPLTGKWYPTVADAIAGFMSRQRLPPARPAPAEKPERTRRFTRYPWSEQDDARLRSMFLEGDTLDLMASAIGVSTSMVCRRLQHLGLSDTTRKVRNARKGWAKMRARHMAEAVQ
jgi:hypothetical protein